MQLCYCLDEQKKSDQHFTELMETLQRASIEQQQNLSICSSFSLDLLVRDGQVLRSPDLRKHKEDRRKQLQDSLIGEPSKVTGILKKWDFENDRSGGDLQTLKLVSLQSAPKMKHRVRFVDSELRLKDGETPEEEAVFGQSPIQPISSEEEEDEGAL